MSIQHKMTLSGIGTALYRVLSGHIPYLNTKEAGLIPLRKVKLKTAFILLYINNISIKINKIFHFWQSKYYPNTYLITRSGNQKLIYRAFRTYITEKSNCHFVIFQTKTKLYYYVNQYIK